MGSGITRVPLVRTLLPPTNARESIKHCATGRLQCSNAHVPQTPLSAHNISTTSENPQSRTAQQQTIPPLIALTMSPQTFYLGQCTFAYWPPETTPTTVATATCEPLEKRPNTNQSSNPIKRANKTYQCIYCDYKARSPSDLTTHIRTHTGGTFYQCTECEYKTTRKNTLVIHIRKHTGERPYDCKYCAYSAKSKSTLVVHIRKHTGEKPYKCDKCPYGAKSNSDLKKHKRKHTGEKPYKCTKDECKFETTSASGLLIHQRQHTPDKPYKCTEDECKFECRQPHNLKRHIKTQHGEKKESMHETTATQRGSSPETLKSTAGNITPSTPLVTDQTSAPTQQHDESHLPPKKRARNRTVLA